MLLILCLHSFYHGSFSLIDFADATHILKEEKRIDWQFILRLLKQYPCAFGIPLTIIDATYLDLFDREIIPRNISKALSNLNPATAGTAQKPLEQSLRRTSIPVPYRRVCLQCSRHRHCPLSLYIDISYTKYSSDKPQPLNQRFYRYLLEYYFILTAVREEYGYRYATRCLYEETGVFVDVILSRLVKMLGKETDIPRLNPNVHIRS
jgi:hypothetical protein